jgi:hypothetical protein
MKTVVNLILSLVLIACVMSFMVPIHAQTPMLPFIILGPVGAPSACAWPPSTTATISSGMALCPTTSGLYYALNGGAFQPVAPAASSGVFPLTPTVPSNNFLNGYTASSGTFSFAQPSFGNISGQITGAQMPASTTCNLSETIGSSNTITISACH